PTEQALFASLAIFVGGWTLAAAEAVYAAMDGDARDVLEAMAALVDHNLIRREVPAEGEPRFGILETIREYARERLAASGRQDAVARAHGMYYLMLVEQLRPAIYGTSQPEYETSQTAALARLEDDHDNLRAALGWTVAV